MANLPDDLLQPLIIALARTPLGLPQALSRLKQGFNSPRERQVNQSLATPRRVRRNRR